MGELVNWLKGKKTYLVAAVVGLIAAAQYLGYEVPPWVFALLGALGLGTLRAGVGKAAKCLLPIALIVFMAGCSQRGPATGAQEQLQSVPNKSNPLIQVYLIDQRGAEQAKGAIIDGVNDAGLQFAKGEKGDAKADAGRGGRVAIMTVTTADNSNSSAGTGTGTQSAEATMRDMMQRVVAEIVAQLRAAIQSPGDQSGDQTPNPAPEPEAEGGSGGGTN